MNGQILTTILLRLPLIFIIFLCINSCFDSSPSPKKLLFEERFENSDPLSGSFVIDKTIATDYALSYVSAPYPVFRGCKAARFELRMSDPEVASGTRSEVALEEATSRDRWYSFAIYFPTDSWSTDNYPEIITQWISYPDEHLGEQWGSPPTRMLIYKNHLYFDVGYNTAQVSSVFEEERSVDLGVVPKNSWQEFVFHIIHSPFSDGVVEVWQNGKKVVDHKGGNSTNDVRLPFWKFGIYKWDWNGNSTTDVSKRVLFIDNIRVADHDASYNLLASDAHNGEKECP